MVIVLHEVSSFTWDTFAFTVVPLAWLEDVGAYVRGERGVWGPSKALVPKALPSLELSSWIPNHSLHTNLMCGGPALVLG